MATDEEVKSYARKLGYTDKELAGKPGGFVQHPDGDFEFPSKGKRRSSHNEKYRRLSVPRWLHLEVKYRAAKSGKCLSQWLSDALGIEPPAGWVYKER